jgi:hypothetical protein
MPSFSMNCRRDQSSCVKSLPRPSPDTTRPRIV